MTEPSHSIYIDTNIFVYAVEGVAETAAPSKKLIEALRRRHGAAITSEITLAELLAPTRRPDALPTQVKRSVYLDLVVESGIFDLVPVRRDILIQTADIRIGRKIKLPDAIHLATAVHAGCGFFVCEDDDFRSLPGEMRRVRPTMRDIDGLLRDIA